MVGSVTPMMAQFSNTGGSKSLIFSEQEVAPYYNRLSVGYNATFMGNSFASLTLNGFTVKYVHGFGLTKSLPLYLETGLKLNMDFATPLEGLLESGSVKRRMLYISIPLNIAYRFGFSNGISLQPYTGFNFKVNAYGEDVTTDIYGRSVSQDLFSKDYNDWKRFQMGWQIGLGLNVKKFYFGFEYGLDFIKLQKGLGTSHVEVSLGLNI